VLLLQPPLYSNLACKELLLRQQQQQQLLLQFLQHPFLQLHRQLVQLLSQTKRRQHPKPLQQLHITLLLQQKQQQRQQMHLVQQQQHHHHHHPTCTVALAPFQSSLAYQRS
jgi:hypothetical protein